MNAIPAFIDLQVRSAVLIYTSYPPHIADPRLTGGYLWCNYKMPKFRKILGGVVLFILLLCFSWRVLKSGEKLSNGRTGLGVSKNFSKYRLFPSLSICMSLKNVTQASLLKDIHGTLQRTLDEVLIDIWHKNGTKSM